MNNLALNKVEMSILGKKIKAARKSKKYTQAQISEMLECSEGHLSAVENGHRMPSGQELVAFCKLYQVELNDLFEGILPTRPSMETMIQKEHQLLDHVSNETLVFMMNHVRMLLSDIESQVQKRNEESVSE